MAHAKHPEHPIETAPMHDAPDAWHDHSADTVKAQTAHLDVINAPLVTGVGVALFLVVLLTTLVIYLYYVSYTAPRVDQSLPLDSPYAVQADQLRAREDAMDQLSRYTIADVNAGKYQIPIETAKQQAIERYNGER